MENSSSTPLLTRSPLFSAGAPTVSLTAHTYAIPGLGFRQLFSPKDDKKAVAIFAGLGKQPFGDGQMLDTYWVYFDDMTFAQFACPVHKPIHPGDPEHQMDPVRFSEGTYALSEGADFRFEEGEKDCGQITIRRTKKLQPDYSYVDYSSEHTYDLNTLGFTMLVLDEE